MAALALLLGCDGLLLHGSQLTAESLQRLAGERLRAILTTLARSRLSALVSGAVITGIVQSSSAIAVLAIAFVSAGFLSVRQAITLILGADVGTTLSAQLLAFRVTDYALLPVTLGFFVLFVGRRGQVKDLGRSLFGFGLMLFSLATLLGESGRSLKAHMRSANGAGCRYALIIGDDEAAAGTAVLRDMTGATEQETLPESEALDRVAAHFAGIES